MSDFLATLRRSAARQTAGTSRAPRLRRNFNWTSAGNLVYGATQWGMIAVVAKLGSPEWVGQYALGLALTAPVLLLTNLQLRALQANDAGGQFEFGHYLGLRLITSAAAAFVIAIIIAVSGLDARMGLITAAIGLAKIVESISDGVYGLLQKRERADLVARSMILRGVLSLLAFGLTIYWRDSVLESILAAGGVWLAVLVAHDLRLTRRAFGASLRPLWHAMPLRSLATIAAPLGVVMMLSALNVSIPCYVLEYLSGTAEVGIFAAIAFVLIGQSALVNALGRSVAPRLAQYFAYSQRREYWSLLKRLVLAGAIGGAAGAALVLATGPFILRLLYRPEYAAYNDLFVILMIGGIFANVAELTGYGLAAARVFHAQVPLLAGESLVLTAACFVLIPAVGLPGAAMAFVAAKIFLTAARLWLLFRMSRAGRVYNREAVLMSEGS